MRRDYSPVLGEETDHEELKHFKDETNDDCLLNAQLSHENRHQRRLQTVHNDSFTFDITLHRHK